MFIFATMKRNLSGLAMAFSTIFCALLAVACRAGAAETDSPRPDVVLIGDSNTRIGGDDCSRPTAWSKWFADSLAPASCRSYARSGATWTNTAATRRDTGADYDILHDDNVIYNQVYRLIEAVDSGRQVTPELIIIGCGTNDAWFLDRRPGALDSKAADIDTVAITAARPDSVTTLAGSVILNVRLLRERFPDARIILLTPHQTTKAPDETIAAVADIIDDCGRLLGCDVIRQDRESGIVSRDEARQLRYTYDGCHTSVEGARHVGGFIARRVASLLDAADSNSNTDTGTTGR